uniref:Uncharacterized protein n=1 Tax=Anguilla anguilla TaxID=7936 RepID=A0A0E9UID4_ANGAN
MVPTFTWTFLMSYCRNCWKTNTFTRRQPIAI